ncbi:hypothetical protein Mapa_018562 [Marchantia paleacea]|nr:hypothetical protein Mapa_018562 [Marchantia paleacea]
MKATNMAAAEHILSSESVQSSSLSLQGVHHIHSSDSLSPRVLGVSHGISDHVLQKDLQNSASLFINQPADTLHSSSSSQTPDGGLRNPLNVISEHLPVSLGASFAQTFTSLPASRHVYELQVFASFERKFAGRYGKSFPRAECTEFEIRMWELLSRGLPLYLTDFRVSDTRVCRQPMGFSSDMSSLCVIQLSCP